MELRCKRMTTLPRQEPLEAALVRHYDGLLQNLTHRLGCRDLAADALQDTWLRLAERPQCAPVQNARGYVYRMAYNRAIDIMRDHRLRGGLEVADDSAPWDDIADSSPGPEHLAQVRNELGRVLRAIGRLPRRRQAICLDVWVQDCPRHEVARRFGVTVGMVFREINAARRDACSTV